MLPRFFLLHELQISIIFVLCPIVKNCRLFLSCFWGEPLYASSLLVITNRLFTLLLYGRHSLIFPWWFFLLSVSNLSPEEVYDFLEFDTAPESSLVAEGVIAEARVPTNMGIKHRGWILKLADSLLVLCPRGNPFTSKDRWNIQGLATYFLLYLFICFKLRVIK